MLDRDTYRSGRGSILEMIRANVEIPSGVILMEDPPAHTGHRSLLSWVFTPKRCWRSSRRCGPSCRGP